MPNNEKIVHVSTREAKTFDDAKLIAQKKGGRLPNQDDYVKESLARMKHGKRMEPVLRHEFAEVFKEQTGLLEYKHEIGESVIFINDYGVNWGLRTIAGRETTSYGPAYYIQPTDTPWFAIPERNLYKADELKNKEGQV